MRVEWSADERGEASAARWVDEEVDVAALVSTWREKGVVTVDGLVSSTALEQYRRVYDAMHCGEVDTRAHRHDLGSHEDQKVTGRENVGQIMWPSDMVEDLSEGPLHWRSFAIARILVGDDAAFDFDMLIWKDGGTDTPTPWHQDEAYWPSGMVDKRSTSCWVALDDASVDNGCMWFVPGSHREEGGIRGHRPAVEGSHVLMTDECEEAEGDPQPLKAGSCTFHHGRMLHYSRGNTTDAIRRAYITNFRPLDMVQYERDNGFDHLRGGWDDFDPKTGGDVYKDVDVQHKTGMPSTSST